MEIKISSLGNGMLISYKDEEEGSEGDFSFTNERDAHEKLAELLAELEGDIEWEDNEISDEMLQELEDETLEEVEEEGEEEEK